MLWLFGQIKTLILNILKIINYVIDRQKQNVASLSGVFTRYLMNISFDNEFLKNITIVCCQWQCGQRSKKFYLFVYEFNIILQRALALCCMYRKSISIRIVKEHKKACNVKLIIGIQNSTPHNEDIYFYHCLYNYCLAGIIKRNLPNFSR